MRFVISASEYLFGKLEAVRNRLEQYDNFALFLDYDGTLTPIVDSPESAVISPQTLGLLQVLCGDRRFRVVVISGRSMKDLEKLLGSVKGVILVGNHGLEIEGHGLYYLNEEAKSKKHILSRIRARLDESVCGFKGALVEDKGLTLSLHYRLVDSQYHDRIHEIFYQNTGEEVDSGDVEVRPGKMVLEIRPKVEWDKGRAVLYLLGLFAESLPSDPYPIYVGDDVTDEDAFRALRGRGLTILVSPAPGETGACYFAKNCKEVYKFLRYLAEW